MALGKGLMQRDHLRLPPNSRTGQIRACAAARTPPPLGETVRFGPLGETSAAHIGARVGKSGGAASPSAGETGLDRP